MNSNSDNSAFAKARTPHTPHSVSQGYDFFDWNKFLDKDLRSLEEWAIAKRLSENWVTCACGNLCDAIPRTSSGDPLDMALSILGMKFYDAIWEKDIKKAKGVLIKIEQRSSEILAEIHNSKTTDS